MDLEKAFDRGVTKKSWDILPRYHMSRPLLQAVKSLYRDHSTCMRVGAGISPWFDIQSGDKQGCAISAWLCNLYLDSCLQGVKDLGVKVGDLKVNCFHRMAGTSEDVTVRMMKNVLRWFGNVERMSDERMVKKIYTEKLSGKREKGGLK